MKDRVSSKPPTAYLNDDEEFLPQYDAAGTGRNSFASSRPDSNRHSILRLSKSIAASFNPTNWKIWSKDKHTEAAAEEETPEAKLLRERQEQAEQMYRQLKESGHFRDVAHISHPPSPQKPSPKKHDSGVEFGDPQSHARSSLEMSRADKRMGKVFLDPPMLQKPRGQSPAPSAVVASETPSPNKPSFGFKRASLSNLNSHFKKSHQPSSARKSLVDEGLTEPFPADLPKQARRVPSRKDLHKQQKLVKRVSDLEGKLEAARRQLSDVLGEPVPALPAPTAAAPADRVSRSRFVPGALPSLLSERLLSGYADPDERDVANAVGAGTGAGAVRERDGRPLSFDDVQRHSEDSPTKPSELRIISDEVTTPRHPPTRTLSKKRKGGMGEEGLAGDSALGESDDSVAEQMTPKRLNEKTASNAQNRPNKLQKTTPSTTATTPSTPGSNRHASPHNQRVSAARVCSRPASAEFSGLVRLYPRTTTTTMTETETETKMLSPSPVRKLTKVYGTTDTALQPPQSAPSPPSSPAFTTSSRLNHHHHHSSSSGGGAVYSADPNTEAGIPPMPPMPKAIRLPGGEVITTTAAAAAAAAARPRRAAAVSATSNNNNNNNNSSNNNNPLPLIRGSFDWPEDCF
jgi:hypothetical protein